MIKRLSTADEDFRQQFTKLRDFNDGEDSAVTQAVATIIAEVRERGDAALLDYTRRFDGYAIDDAAEFELPRARLQNALASINPELRAALQQAADRIREFHQNQTQSSWSITEADGSELGQRVTALERVGVYVPGGKAAYPSTVLMNVIPAKVAGVSEIIMTVPAPDGHVEDSVLAAAAIAGVDRAFCVGGAQAVAALAYGTATVPSVDKIVGPGNIYVATAKRMVFGRVGIDMFAGPSEILIVCDGATNPDWVAMDLFSQAEHDEDAQAILMSPDTNYLDAVEQAINRLLAGMERADIIGAALSGRGALILVRDLDEAVALTNEIAPEHLQLSVEAPEAMLEHIQHAGAVFLGRHTSEVLGDYCAGPNHVLPTGRTARFSSPLGVYDFQKRMSVIKSSAEGASRLGRTAAVLARAEGLTAHARSAEYRVDET